MSVRALIIAIQDYPHISASDGLASSLPSTNELGEQFLKWLVDIKKVPRENIQYCGTSKDAGTGRAEILAEIVKLVKKGREETEELYVLFSGHGFAYREAAQRRPTDILVASDFVDCESSGGACLKLDEIQDKLRMAMGPGHHYYFLDACRNQIAEGDVNPLDMGHVFPPSRLGMPCLFTLYSTAPTEPAREQSGFARLLLDGLKGRGRAKGWQVQGAAEKMFVTFDSLWRYVRDGVGGEQRPDAKFDGACDGLILALEPTPVSKCLVRVANAESNDTFLLYVRDARGFNTNSYELKEAPYQVELKLPPEYYVMWMSHPHASMRRSKPKTSDPIDLYDDVDIEFLKEPRAVYGLRGPKPVPLNSQLNISVPIQASAEFRIFDLQRGKKDSITPTGAGTSVPLPAGKFRIEWRERGYLLSSNEVEVSPGQSRDFQFKQASPSAAQKSFLLATKNQLGEPAEFSETLGGPIVNDDLGLWLSFLGASHIVAPETHHRLCNIELMPLESAPELAQLYVLAGSDDLSPSFELRLFQQGGVHFSRLKHIEGLDNISQARMTTEPGPALFSVQTGPNVWTAFVTHCVANRATLVTVTRHEGRFHIHQYLLPVESLAQHLPRMSLRKDQYLPAIRTSWFAQRSFAARDKVIFTHPVDMELWSNPSATSFDPMMTLLAAYESIRRGDLRTNSSNLEEMLARLRTYMRLASDPDIITALLHKRQHEPKVPPIVIDGLLACQASWPIAGRISYQGAWSTWRVTTEELEKLAQSLETRATAPGAVDIKTGLA